MPLNAFTFANVPASTTDQILIPALPGKLILIRGVACEAGAVATDITFNSKPPGTIGTAISAVFQIHGNGGFTLPYNEFGFFQTRHGDALSCTTSAGSTVGVQLIYEYRDQSGLILETVNSFTPSSISGLQLWYDATQQIYTDVAGTTSANVNGELVALWKDLSGNGYHMEQPTSTKRPILITNDQNGKNGLHFNDGVREMVSSISQTQPFTIAMVHKTRAVADPGIVASWRDSPPLLWFAWFGASSGYLMGNGTAGLLTGARPYTTSAVLHIQEWDAAKSKYYVNFENPKLAGSLFDNDPLTNILFGPRPAGYGIMNQSYNEFILYNKILPTGDRQALMEYLKTKWAVV